MEHVREEHHRKLDIERRQKKLKDKAMMQRRKERLEEKVLYVSNT